MKTKAVFVLDAIYNFLALVTGTSIQKSGNFCTQTYLAGLSVE
jgi:hypothetical protein